jgi:hypothetical protein
VRTKYGSSGMDNGFDILPGACCIVLEESVVIDGTPCPLHPQKMHNRGSMMRCFSMERK